MMENYIKHNQEAWDKQVQKGNQWTIPVSPEQLMGIGRVR